MKKTKKLLLLIVTSFILLISCLPVFDSLEVMRIINCSADTIVIGSAHCYNIDSVRWVVERFHAKFDTTWTKIDNMGCLKVCENDLIPPDSMGCYAEPTLFGYSQEHKGYFFIFKLKDIKEHSWNEIRQKQLYDTMVVTREMLGEKGIIEYKGNR